MTGTAIITGGAGGIAGELAPLLLKRGFQLVLLDRDERRLSERAQALGAIWIMPQPSSPTRRISRCW
jgi:short-subunit dehydrogenase